MFVMSDEIEWRDAMIRKLRGALKEITDEYTKGKDDADTAGYMAVIARKALVGPFREVRRYD